jgi:hypothetical protein
MDELREVAWELAAGRKFPEDLPMAAALALARGIDSPALRELAGLGRRSDTTELRSLFELALSQLKMMIPSPDQAARRDLHRLAQEFVAGNRTPHEIARICDPAAAWMNSVESDFVSQCCYFEDMIDYIPAHRAPAIMAALREAAHTVADSETES